MSPPREIRRDYYKSNRRIKKKYFKAYKSRSNQQTVQRNNLSNDRIATLGSQVWQSRRNKVRNIFEQNRNQFGNHMHRNRRASSELRFRTQRNTRLNRTKRTNFRTRPVDNSHASVNPSDYEVYRNNNAYLHNRGSSRRAQFHRCHCQHRSDKRRHVRQGRPHHLDLSDPMFRQGPDVYMRQELTSLAREFIQQREPLSLIHI